MISLVLGAVIVVIDQVSKYWTRQNFSWGESRSVIPGLFDLTYVRNTGAMWGMFGGGNQWLVLLSLAVLIVIGLIYRRITEGMLGNKIALGLMFGGITGNLLDRFRLGWVTDFFDFHWANHHWPAFNVADAAICVGVALYVFFAFWRNRRAPGPGSIAGIS